MTLTAEFRPERDGHLACSYLIDGHRFRKTPAERREWMRDHGRAARDSDGLEAIRQLEQILLADGDQPVADRAARENLRAALVSASGARHHPSSEVRRPG